MKKIIPLIFSLFFSLTLQGQTNGGWGICEFSTVAAMNAFDPSGSNYSCKKVFVQATNEHYQWDGTVWVLESTGGSSDNIYTTDNTLAGDRVVTLANYNMHWNMTGTGDFEVLDNGTVAFSVNDGGNVGIGTSLPDEKLHVVGSIKMVDGNEGVNKIMISDANGVGSWGTLAAIDAGWHGSATRIKILFSDFNQSDDNLDKMMSIEDDFSDYGIKVGNNSNELYASIVIPTNYQATDVILYGNNTATVTVYEVDITDGLLTSLGSGSVGSNINITDVYSNSTNYLLIHIDVTATNQKIYGGYVTISN